MEIKVRDYNEWALLENGYKLFSVYTGEERKEAIKIAERAKVNHKSVLISHKPQGGYFIYTK